MGGLSAGLMASIGSPVTPGIVNAPGVGDAAGGRSSPVTVGGEVGAPRDDTAAATINKQEDKASAKSSIIK
jgi:hypothetical protein